MARKVTEIIVDDIDGTEITDGGGETILFALDGVQYEIDLTDAHAAQLREALEPYTKAGRRASASQRRSTSRKGSTSSGRNLSAVRAWLREQGHDVPARGRISSDLMEIYDAAH